MSLILCEICKEILPGNRRVTGRSPGVLNVELLCFSYKIDKIGYSFSFNVEVRLMEAMKLMVTNYEEKITEDKAEKVKHEVMNENKSGSLVDGFLNLI